MIGAWLRGKSQIATVASRPGVPVSGWTRPALAYTNSLIPGQAFGLPHRGQQRSARQHFLILGSTSIGALRDLDHDFYSAKNQEHHAQNAEENGRPTTGALIRRIVGEAFSLQFFQPLNVVHKSFKCVNLRRMVCESLQRYFKSDIWNPAPARQALMAGEAVGTRDCHEFASRVNFIQLKSCSEAGPLKNRRFPGEKD
jgi:hypothetical protein